MVCSFSFFMMCYAHYPPFDFQVAMKALVSNMYRAEKARHPSKKAKAQWIRDMKRNVANLEDGSGKKPKDLAEAWKIRTANGMQEHVRIYICSTCLGCLTNPLYFR